jgi:hypothetical protein
MHLRALVVLACGIAAPAAALDEPWSFRDWRLAITAVETPDIEENLKFDTPGSGPNRKVDWSNGEADPGIRLAIETVGGTLIDGDGFVWGAALGATRWGVEPDGYTSEGDAYSASGTSLDFTAISWRWQAGWAWGDRIGQSAAWHAELLAVLGGGWTFGETETFFDSDNDGTIDGSSVDAGGGPMAEGGLRAAAGIMERNVQLLFTAGWTWSKSWLEVDIPGGSSDLTVDATGFDFGLSLGYRF